MKLSPQDKELARLFSSSKFSAEGFLGDDTRSVDEIIADDQTTVARLNTTCEAIATALTAIFNKAEAALGDSVTITDAITATHFESRGKIPSPFQGEGVFPKGEVLIVCTTSKVQLHCTRLGIHLIKKHCFFQGCGSRYRIEPEDAVTLLGII